MPRGIGKSQIRPGGQIQERAFSKPPHGDSYPTACVHAGAGVDLGCRPPRSPADLEQRAAASGQIARWLWLPGVSRSTRRDGERASDLDRLGTDLEGQLEREGLATGVGPVPGPSAGIRRSRAATSAGSQSPPRNEAVVPLAWTPLGAASAARARNTRAASRRLVRQPLAAPTLVLDHGNLVLLQERPLGQFEADDRLVVSHFVRLPSRSRWRTWPHRQGHGRFWSDPLRIGHVVRPTSWPRRPAPAMPP